MFMPNGVELKVRAPNPSGAGHKGFTLWAQTVAEATDAIAVLKANAFEVVEATVREVEQRKVPLAGWKFDARS